MFYPGDSQALSAEIDDLLGGAGDPAPRLGFPKAIVVPHAGRSPSPAALAAWVAETLAAFKVPAHFEVRSEPLPRNAAGKVLKGVLLGESENPFREE